MIFQQKVSNDLSLNSTLQSDVTDNNITINISTYTLNSSSLVKLDNINILPTDISFNSLQSTLIHSITSIQSTSFTISHEIGNNDPLIFLEIDISGNTSNTTSIQKYYPVLYPDIGMECKKIKQMVPLIFGNGNGYGYIRKTGLDLNYPYSRHYCFYRNLLSINHHQPRLLLYRQMIVL